MVTTFSQQWLPQHYLRPRAAAHLVFIFTIDHHEYGTLIFHCQMAGRSSAIQYPGYLLICSTRRQHPSSTTLLCSNMAYSLLRTCWTSIMRIYPSGALSLSSLVASSFPNRCSSLPGSTACTSLIPKSRLSAQSWI